MNYQAAVLVLDTRRAATSAVPRMEVQTLRSPSYLGVSTRIATLLGSSVSSTVPSLNGAALQMSMRLSICRPARRSFMP
ncbi:hypothetical protein C8Q74DRAFT_1300551 [Fomes fomentarius]|nr:hypothetical protein C8Q74DRAFT_1300551 [Fomes fomentarius]